MDKDARDLTLDDIYQSWREVWARRCVEQNGDNNQRRKAEQRSGNRTTEQCV